MPSNFDRHLQEIFAAMKESPVEISVSERKPTCVHCGEACDTTHIVHNDLDFCCEGCQWVYQILHDNNLQEYYKIQQSPGINQRVREATDYAFLDEPEIQQKIIDYASSHLIKVTFHLPAIHCASCIWLLEHLYKLVPGVSRSQVDFLRKKVTIHYDPTQVTLRRIAEMLEHIGYAPSLNMGQLEEKKLPVVPRKLYYQLGVAGFCFGNIMLLSFPEYLGIEGDQASRWFNYLNWGLGLPVLLYGAQDYLKSAWHGVKNGGLNMDVPITLGIIALFVRSTIDIFGNYGSGYMDSLAGLVFFLLIGKWFQQKTFHHLSFDRDYKSYFPIAISVWQEDRWTTIPLSKVEPGQRIQIKNNQLIPADGILLTPATQIDYSFVTGESDPVFKRAGDTLYAGGKQIGSPIEIQVTKAVGQSYLLQLWEDRAFTQKKETRDHRLADQIGTYFTVAILTIAGITFLYWSGKDLNMALVTVTSVLIIACPCALALAIPFTYGNVMRLLADKNMYLRSTRIIEEIQRLTHIVFDKTGTLTAVNDYHILFHGTPLSEAESVLVRSVAHASTHPLSHQLDLYLNKYQLGSTEDFREEPGQGVTARVAGQVVRIGSANWTGAPNPGSNGKQSVHISIDGTYRGNYLYESRYRASWRKTIKVLARDYQLSLLSGDGDRELRRIRSVFPATSTILFNQKPKDKLEYIRALQDAEQRVMMIGDGINDAGALQASEVGLVITEDINNFTPASDAIIHNGLFPYLPQLIQYTRLSRRVVFGAYFLALLYNVVGLSFAVQGMLSPLVAAVLMPISSVTMVLYGLSASTLLFRIMKLNELPQADWVQTKVDDLYQFST